MIKDTNHASTVQQRRYDRKKRGYAKAVRPFMRRAGDSYSDVKAALPVRW